MHIWSTRVMRSVLVRLVARLDTNNFVSFVLAQHSHTFLSWHFDEWLEHVRLRAVSLFLFAFCWWMSGSFSIDFNRLKPTISHDPFLFLWLGEYGHSTITAETETCPGQSLRSNDEYTAATDIDFCYASSRTTCVNRLHDGHHSARRIYVSSIETLAQNINERLHDE